MIIMVRETTGLIKRVVVIGKPTAHSDTDMKIRFKIKRQEDTVKN